MKTLINNYNYSIRKKISNKNILLWWLEHNGSSLLESSEAVPYWIDQSCASLFTGKYYLPTPLCKWLIMLSLQLKKIERWAWVNFNMYGYSNNVLMNKGFSEIIYCLFLDRLISMGTIGLNIINNYRKSARD